MPQDPTEKNVSVAPASAPTAKPIDEQASSPASETLPQLFPGVLLHLSHLPPFPADTRERVAPTAALAPLETALSNAGDLHHSSQLVAKPLLPFVSQARPADPPFLDATQPAAATGPSSEHISEPKVAIDPMAQPVAEELPAVVVERKRRTWGAVWRWCFVIFVPTTIAIILIVMLQQVPEFYRKQNQIPFDSKVADRSQSFWHRAVQLMNQSQQELQWQESFSQDEVNAFLMADLDQEQDQLSKSGSRSSLPASIQQPRLVFLEDEMLIGCRYCWGKWSTVVHARFRVWVPRSNLIALELREASAGTLPIPPNYVRQMVEWLASGREIEVRWKRNGTHLVVLLELPQQLRGVKLQRLQCHEHELVVGGINDSLDHWHSP